MEYFTLSEDLEEIQSAKNKLRTRILIGVVIVGSVFLLRSSGVINIEYNKAYFKGNHRTKKEIYEVYNDGAKGTINDNKKTGSLATDDKDSYFKFGDFFQKRRSLTG